MNKSQFRGDLLPSVTSIWPAYEIPEARLEILFGIVQTYSLSDVIDAMHAYASEYPDEDKPRKLWSYLANTLCDKPREAGRQMRFNGVTFTPAEKSAIVKALRDAVNRDAYHENDKYRNVVGTMNDEKLWHVWLEQEGHLGSLPDAARHWIAKYGHSWKDDQEFVDEGRRVWDRRAGSLKSIDDKEELCDAVVPTHVGRMPASVKIELLCGPGTAGRLSDQELKLFAIDQKDYEDWKREKVSSC